MTARHDTRLAPVFLVVSEVQTLPADVMVSPDLTKTTLQDIISDLKSKVSMIQNILRKNNSNNKIEIVEEEKTADYLSSRGSIKNTHVTLKIKKEIEKESKGETKKESKEEPVESKNESD